MYAKVGGISTKELNILEIEFLFLIDWQLTASVEVLQNYYVNLVKQIKSYVPPSPSVSSPSLPTPSSSSPYPSTQPQQQDAEMDVDFDGGVHGSGLRGVVPNGVDGQSVLVGGGREQGGMRVSEDIEWVD
ncbi:hypothetical protein HDV00_000727 [Rhizophlyctis rosea]|nr:hypothetical protein HDV00_000727 [Rhizophlyctis rosea]